MPEQFEPDFRSIADRAGPFPIQAYEFVRQGLAHTVKTIHGESEERASEENRHVSGQQLCLGLKDFAILQYGLLAKTVLHSWHIRGTDDFGRIVFAMIEAGFMRKTDDDSPEDFCQVFDFDEAFSDLSVSR